MLYSTNFYIAIINYVIDPDNGIIEFSGKYTVIQFFIQISKTPINYAFASTSFIDGRP